MKSPLLQQLYGMLCYQILVHPNPGPTNDVMYSIKCLYLNARSLMNKTDKLQTLTTDVDLIAITETWLKSNVLNSKLLPGNDFTILTGKTEQEAGYF